MKNGEKIIKILSKNEKVDNVLAILSPRIKR